jgi:hypothetical protein
MKNASSFPCVHFRSKNRLCPPCIRALPKPCTKPFFQLGDVKKCLDYCLRSLAIQEHSLPPMHQGTAAYRALGDYKKCLDHFQRSLAIFKELLPPMHPNITDCLTNVRAAHGRLRRDKPEFK